MPQVVVTRYTGRDDNSPSSLHQPLQEIAVADVVVKTSFFGTPESLEREVNKVVENFDAANVVVRTKEVTPDWSQKGW